MVFESTEYNSYKAAWILASYLELKYMWFIFTESWNFFFGILLYTCMCMKPRCFAKIYKELVNENNNIAFII